MKKRCLLLCLIIFMSISTLAQNEQPYHLKLLAVQDMGSIYIGSDADLFLEVREGSGRVFLETFPLTKIDTQISTRFAKEIACSHFKLNCNKFDFIFTIKAKSNIIGGPSAGAAIAALTTIAMLDLDYDQGIAVTGTINSGGIIGPVGGIKEKLEAAAKINLTKVLIAQGTASQKLIPEETNVRNQSIQSNVTNQSMQTNGTMDLIQYSRDNLSLEVLEVIDLDEVVFHLTGINLNHKNFTVVENEEYTKIMQKLEKTLCNRHKKMEDEIKVKKIIINESLIGDIKRKIGQAENASKIKDYYSAASFCFGANIDLRTQYYSESSPNKGKLTQLFRKLEKDLVSLEEKITEENIETISDLQTKMVVKERLQDVKIQLKKFQTDRNKTSLPELYYLLAYAEERYFSAVSWMQFFSMDGKKFEVNEELLQNSCMQKISESEERFQYVSLFISAQKIREKIDTATSALHNGEFDLCLITASQAKADANAILSTVGVGEDTIDEFIASKKKAAERIIALNSEEGIFPILGYSYYQYANSLREQEKFTALAYLEYALEMSNINMYFPGKEEYLEKEEEFVFDEKFVHLLIGIFIGFVIGLLWKRKKK